MLLRHIRARFGRDIRGQVITLEAITGAIILLLMVLVALQSTVITPLSASTSNQQIEKQNRALANDVLDTAAANNAIVPVVLNWEGEQNGFQGTNATTYYTGGVPTDSELGKLLNNTFTNENIAYNIYIQYQSERDVTATNETTLVYQGEPSYNAATATKTIFLHQETVENSGSKRYIPDINENSQLENVIRLKLVVWRM